MPSLAGINYKVLNDGASGSLKLSQGAIDAQFTYQCAYSDMYTLAIALKGYTSLVGGALVFHAPQQHPVIPSLYVSEVDAKPTRNTKATADFQWDLAELAVTYAPLPFGQPTAQDYVEVALDVSGSVISLPGSYFSFSDNTIPVRDLGITVPFANLTITKYMVPFLDTGTIFDLIGKLNNATFFGAATGKVLYAGAKATRKITNQSTEEWTLQHSLLYNPLDHRAEWNPNNHTWDTSLTPPKYQTGNFNALGLGH